MKSLGHVLEEHRGIGPGFDFLRIGLAISIVFFHSLQYSQSPLLHGPLWFAEYAFVAMFFSLSGFLITGSATRLKLKDFLINRSLRILPALAVDIFICALVIGPLVTTTPLSSYFLDTRFYAYFLNAIGYIHYYLPGVFELNENQKVNGALWTVPYEIICYAMMAVLVISNYINSHKAVLLAYLMLLLTGMFVEHFHFGEQTLSSRAGYSKVDLGERVLYLLFVFRGAQLLAAFLLGVLMYQMRKKIAYSRIILGLCLLVCAVAVFKLDTTDIDHVGNRFILLPAICYITVFMGLTRIPVWSVFKAGDYSYGVYLYHMPIVQLMLSTFPAFFRRSRLGSIALFLACIPFVFLIAKLSWHLIEKPVLQLRKKFSFVARVRGVDGSGPAGGPEPLPADKPALVGKASG